MPSISTLWTAPLINTYNDLIIQSSSPTSTLNLSLLIMNTSPTIHHTCIPVIGKSILLYSSNLLAFIHSNQLTSIKSPIVLPTSQEQFSNYKIIFIPSHVILIFLLIFFLILIFF